MKFYKDLIKYQRTGNKAVYFIAILLPAIGVALGGGPGAIFGGLLFLIVLFVAIPNALGNAAVDINIEKVENIIEKGTKVPGTIVSFRTDPEFDDYEHSVFEKTTDDSLSMDTANTIFTIEYEYNGEKHTFDAPPTVFSFEMIESNDVDVYILDDKVFVDNYKINLEELDEYIQQPKDFAKAFIVATVALIALGGLCLLLGFMEIIPLDFAVSILTIVAIVYIVVVLIAHAKNK